MAKHFKMTDGAHHIVVSEARVDFMKEKGFSVVGDATLSPGQLVGHIRVRKPARPPAPNHVKREVEATDGFQVIRVDAAHQEMWAKYERKGFVELPPLPKQPDYSVTEDVDEITRMAIEWNQLAAPIKEQRERIKKTASENGRYAQ